MLPALPTSQVVMVGRESAFVNCEKLGTQGVPQGWATQVPIPGRSHPGWTSPLMGPGAPSQHDTENTTASCPGDISNNGQLPFLGSLSGGSSGPHCLGDRQPQDKRARGNPDSAGYALGMVTGQAGPELGVCLCRGRDLVPSGVSLHSG